MGERREHQAVVSQLFCFVLEILMYLTKRVTYFVVVCVCACVLMQAEEARLWFHYVILGEERRIVCSLEVVSCISFMQCLV